MSDARKPALPEDSQARKDIPITTGLLDYFAAALAEVAKVSVAGNNKHNPGEPLHWSRGKSSDHADCIGRHLIDRGGFDKDGMRHSALLAWRSLANLQEELEAAGAPPSRASRFPEPKQPRGFDLAAFEHKLDESERRIRENQQRLEAEVYKDYFRAAPAAPWYRRAWWRILDALGLDD